ncbi:MAG: tetratricopeptide repeat protein [Gammaproteobacteria bacterium]
MRKNPLNLLPLAGFDRIFCAVLVWLAGTVPVSGYNDAGAALARGDYAAAYRAFAARAERGDPVAQNNLGVLYLKGRGTPRDFGSARVWFEQAAAQGLPGAKHNLGMMYLRGYGMTPDPVEAARWLTAAAEDGDREAQFFTGLLHYRGEGVARDAAVARRWFTRAADQGLPSAVYNLAVMQVAGEGGARDEQQAVTYLEKHRHTSEPLAILLSRIHLAHADDPRRGDAALAILKPLAEGGSPEAQFELGMMYVAGRGVARDLEEGRFWLQQASRLGFGPAQLNLGSLYARGLGVTPDPVEATVWFTLAAANGESLAAQYLNVVQDELSGEDRARAEQQVAAFREKHAGAVKAPAHNHGQP